MRKAIRGSNSSFLVAKNTLARIAADNAGRPELKEIIDGPIGFMTTGGDPAAAAKVFVKYIDDNSVAMTIVGGVLDSQALDADRVKALAKLPPKEELIAKLLGSMNSPITGLLIVMNGPMSSFARALKRIAEKRESQAAGVTAAE
jgi:large subunit ribosomal protein L10